MCYCIYNNMKDVKIVDDFQCRMYSFLESMINKSIIEFIYGGYENL